MFTRPTAIKNDDTNLFGHALNYHTLCLRAIQTV